MRTLLLNPPLFKDLAATRETESYWYPIDLCHAARMLPQCKVVDAPSHNISAMRTIDMAKNFDLVVVSTSVMGLSIDLKIAEMMKNMNPSLKVGFVGLPVTIETDLSLQNPVVDFVV